MIKIKYYLKSTFGIGITICLFAGVLAFILFILAICIGGQIATEICIFVHKLYFPWVIRITSLVMFIGLTSLYLNKEDN